MNPFRFGALALDEAFADREAEVQELKFDVLNGQDVVIFAPRRFGKSSLVWKAMQQLVGTRCWVAYVNLMTTPTKAKLAGKLAAAIYEHVAPPGARARERALAPFRGLRVSPRVTVDPENGALPLLLRRRPRRRRTSTRRSSACSSCRPSSPPTRTGAWR